MTAASPTGARTKTMAKKRTCQFGKSKKTGRCLKNKRRRR